MTSDAPDSSRPRVVELARTDRDPTTAEPAALPDDTLAPPAPDLRTVFQGGTFILLLLAACYGAAEIILPIVVAFVLMLVLQPAVRFLQQWHVPRVSPRRCSLPCCLAPLVASVRPCQAPRPPGLKRSRPTFPSYRNG